jgi:hypothetical protein
MSFKGINMSPQTQGLFLLNLTILPKNIIDKEKIGFIRTEDRKNCSSFGDLKTSAAVHTFHKIAEEKSRFTPSFWLKSEKEQ